MGTTSEGAEWVEGHAAAAIVGREAELAELERLLGAAASGRGAVCLITGEPGIGKTALASAFGARAAADATVLWGACWAAGSAPAYWPWRQALRSLLDQRDAGALRDAVGAGAAHAALVLPELGGEPAPGADAEPSRFALFEAIAALLAAAARTLPVVVVLDDAHDADAPSVALLEFLARTLAAERVLFVATAREREAELREDLGTPLARVGPDVRQLALSGLGPAEVGALVAARAPAAGRADDRLVGRLLERTNGNPLFLEGLLTLADLAGGELTLPASLRDTIRRRLAPLSPEASELLAVASVIGLEFPLGVLAAAAGRDPAEVLALLEPARRLGLVDEVARGGELRMTFPHALVRETLYEGLAAARRAELHRAAGEVLERRLGTAAAPPLAELAHHFARAAPLGEALRARDYAARAAEHASAVCAWEEAARHLEAALELHAQLPPDEEALCGLLLALGRARTRGGDVETARATLVDAAGVARRLGAARQFVLAALELGAVGLPPGDVDHEVVALLEEALRLLDDHPTALRGRVLARLAVQLYWTAAPERRAALVAEARAIAATLDGEPAAQLDVLAQIHLATAGPEDADRLAALDRLVALAVEAEDPERELQVRIWRIAALTQLGLLRDAAAEIEAFARLCERLHQPRWLWYVPLLRGVRALAEGRLDDAERLREEAAHIGLQVHGSMAPQLLGAQLVATRWTQRDLAGLLEPVTQLTDANPSVVGWRCVRVATLVDAGRDEEARAEIERLTAGGEVHHPVDTTFLSSCALLADAVGRLGDAGPARVLYDALAPYEGHNATLPSGAFVGPVARHLGVLAAAAGDHDRALEHLAAARTTAQRGDMRAMLAWIALDEAAVRRARNAPGDAEAARASLEHGSALALEARLPALATRAREMLDGGAATATAAGAGDRSAPGTAAEPSAIDGLLRREGDVWTVEVGGRRVRVRHAKGLVYLAELVSRPGVEIHAVELVGARADVAEDGDLGPLLDGPAKAAFRARAEELRAAVEEAERFHDPERAARAREELDALAGELSRAVGLGGRDRRPGSTAERARVNATRAIRSVLRRIAEHDASLGQELLTTVETGTFCSYRPDPRRPVRWRVEGG